MVRILRLLLISLLVACGLPQEQLAGTPPDLQTQVLVRGLDTPWAIDFAADGRIFVTERVGRIRVVEGGQLRPEPWMTLPVTATGEAGLMGLALDPQFAQNRFVYVAYTYRAATGRLQNRLVRLREDPTTGKGSLDKVLIDNVAGANNHDGGRVKFGPDGRLYWSMGDAQTARLAQDLSSLNGKILRLNSDGTIPTDNPWVPLRILGFPIPMCTLTATVIPKVSHGNPQPNDCMQLNMAPAASKAVAGMKSITSNRARTMVGRKFAPTRLAKGWSVQ